MAMWTHGHSPIAETQNVKITSLGWGSLMQAPQNSLNTEWLHYSIPTPVLLNGARPQILRVMLLFSTINKDTNVNSGLLTNVHVWDRDRRILEINGLDLTGDFLELGGSNNFAFPPNTIPFFGVGVSIGYHFDPAHRDGLLLVTSVGADFQF